MVVNTESPVKKDDCMAEEQFGESYDFHSTAGIKSPTFHFETNTGNVRSIEIGEGEIANITGVVDYLDPKTSSASFRWFDDSGNTNFCKIDTKDPTYKFVKWRAPQVDSDLTVTLGAQLQGSNVPPVTEYFQIKVINTDSSQVKPFSIVSLENDQNYPSGTYLPNIKLTAKLDTPQEIIKAYSSTKHEVIGFGEFGNEFRLEKISATQYSIELDTAFDYSQAPRDIRIRLQNDRNVFAEKEIVNVPMPEKQIPYTVKVELSGSEQRSKVQLWACIREANTSNNIACSMSYDQGETIRINSDKRYVGKDLEAYLVLRKSPSEATQSYDDFLKLKEALKATVQTEDELRAIGIILKVMPFHSKGLD